MAYQTRSSRTETLLLEELRARQCLHVERIEGTHHPEYRVGVSEWMDEWGGGAGWKNRSKAWPMLGLFGFRVGGTERGGAHGRPLCKQSH